MAIVVCESFFMRIYLLMLPCACTGEEQIKRYLETVDWLGQWLDWPSF